MRRVILAIAILVTGLSGSGIAFAHDLHAPAGAPPAWTWDPWIIVPLGLSALLFGVGWQRLAHRSTQGLPALKRRLALFAGGWLTLVASLVSPLHQAGERSFAAHMFEHELLMLLAAPLLVLSEPLVLMLWAFPASGRRAIGGMARLRAVSAVWTRLTEPVTATLVQAAVLWGWHAPTLFDLALSNDGWHAVQHLSFLLSALLFWTAMIGPRGARSSAPSARGLSALCLFATSVVSGALGALMAFSASPWYLGYARLGMAPFGLTPAEDQQLAGLIMWIPGGLVHAGAALALVSTLLKTPAHEKVATDAV
jgi:cytochrome c oxidase assembly factor CtaG